MRIVNDERLVILKEYARNNFGLTKNVRILVLLITEKETDRYRILCSTEVERNPNLKDFIRKHPPNKARHETLTAFATEACVINMKKNLFIKALNDLVIISKIKIKHLEKYEYIVLIREELLEPFGKRKMSTSFKECDANYAELAFCILLSHEFLHIVEEVTGIQVYGSQEKDDINQLKLLNTLPIKYWEKGIKNGVVSFTF